MCIIQSYKIIKDLDDLVIEKIFINKQNIEQLRYTKKTINIYLTK